MACPITMIYKFINEYKSINTEINVEDFRKKIYDDFSIMTKYYEEDNLLLAYHKFDLPAKTQMEKDCRSLIIDMKTLQIISYTCPTPIVNNEAQQLSLDHKPNVPEEKKRIERLGGKITFDGYDWRIKSLSLSRAFGDLDCQPYVTHIPNIFKYNIDNKDNFLIIACDGLWDVLSNKKAVDFVKNLQANNFTGNYAKELAQYGLNNNSLDNITVVIYFFN